VSALATLRSMAVLMLVAALSACNAGQAEQRATANEMAAPEVSATTPVVATMPVGPAANIDEPATNPGATAASTRPIVAQTNTGRSCNTDADCTIKDVGSCCGYRPQCLNKETPTFPEQVKEQCAREGRVSTCGMLAVSGCQCHSGKCDNVLQSDESMSAPAAPAPLK
jgi:hypothetical protein